MLFMMHWSTLCRGGFTYQLRDRPTSRSSSSIKKPASRMWLAALTTHIFGSRPQPTTSTSTSTEKISTRSMCRFKFLHYICTTINNSFHGLRCYQHINIHHQHFWIIYSDLFSILSQQLYNTTRAVNTLTFMLIK